MLNFTYGDENKVGDGTKMIHELPSLVINANDTESRQIEVTSLEVGHLVIGMRSDDVDM